MALANDINPFRDEPAAAPAPAITTTSPSASTAAISPSDAASSTPSSAEPAVYLSNLEPVDGDPRSQSATLYDGKSTSDFTSSITSSINSFDSEKKVVYTIEDGWNHFRATIGIDTSSKPGAKVNFRVYLDGDQVGSGNLLTMQETKELDIPVTGRSQIQLVITAEKTGGVGGSGRAVWGDARFTTD
nr:hypothetical protein Ade03nite_39940 [Actinoplanes derwentensis]